MDDKITERCRIELCSFIFSPSDFLILSFSFRILLDFKYLIRALIAKKIQKELAAGRTDVAENLQEVLDSLTDVIEDGKGNFSDEMLQIYGSYKEAYL